jgi:hypothetical protein
LEGSLLLSLVAGAAGGSLLLGGRLLAMRIDPRPCWQKNECALRRADPDVCSVCPVYLDRDVPAESFVIKELNLPPLRHFSPTDAEVA